MKEKVVYFTDVRGRRRVWARTIAQKNGGYLHLNLAVVPIRKPPKRK